MFGGEDGSRRALADVFVLDLASLTWSTPEVRRGRRCSGGGGERT